MTPDDRIDAAELALGLIEGQERAVALERVLADPDFAAELAWWRAKFAALYDGYTAVEPPAFIADSIQALIDAPAGSAPVTTAPRRWPWLLGGLVGGALAASAAALLLVQNVSPPAPVAVERPRPAPLLVAALAAAKGEERSAIAAVVDPGAQVIRVAAVATPPGRTAQLWRIGSDGVPRALGLLSSTRPTRLSVRRPLFPLSGETLAVSIEPLGGSRTGAPTGPVVASGSLTSG